MINVSICIPTYNRCRFLEESLLSIIDAVSGYENEIEIIILDNASTDETFNVVSTFSQKYHYIKYFKNDENIGAEKNIRAVTTRAGGEYIWLFGDDDKIYKHAIKLVLNLLKTKEIDVLIPNYSVWTKDFKIQLRARDIPIKSKEVIFRDSDHFLQKIGIFAGYISILIIKKEIFLKLPIERYNQFIETGFPFLLSVYSGILPNKKCYFINEVLVANRTDNSHQYNFYQYFVVGIGVIFNELIALGYSHKAVRFAKRNIMFKSIMKYYLSRKRDGIDKKKDFSLIFNEYKSDPLFWVFYMPMFLFLPKWLLQFIRKRRG